MMRRRRWAGIAAGLLSCVVICSACGSQAVPGTEVKQTAAPDGEKVKPAPYEEVSGSVWGEKWTVECGDQASVDVEMAALVTVPNIPRMGILETEEIRFGKEEKEKIARAFFGDSDIYCFDAESVPREELEKRLAKAKKEKKSCRESLELMEGLGDETDEDLEGSRKEFEEAEKRVKRLGKLLRAAGTDYVRAQTGNFSGNYYVGMRGEVPYHLNFAYDEDGFYDGNGDANILMIEPDNYADIAPESLRGESDLDVGTKDPGVDPGSNKCQLSEEEAVKLVEDFLREAGISDSSFNGKKTDWLRWTTIPGEEGTIAEDTCGYSIRYQMAMDGVDVGLCNMEFYVADEGIIQASWLQPMHTVSRTEEVSMIKFDSIQDIFREQINKGLSDEVKKNNGISKSVRADVRFTKIELRYGIVESGEEGSSFVPVWYLEGEDAELCVNAIDGSVVAVMLPGIG